MTEMTQTSELAERMLKLRDAIAASHARSNRAALLEHARMGRSVPSKRDGEIVMLSPEEVFAIYDLDENGKPKA